MNLEFVRKLRIRQQFNGQFAEGFCCGFLKACMKVNILRRWLPLVG